jgi:hypothetical protein
VAKLVTSVLAGAAFGLLAEGATIGLGSVVLSARGLPIRLAGGDYTQLLLGGTAAAALWAPLGLGVGALLRNQVGTIVGLCAWLLFVESVLIGQLPGAIRYFPGSAADAISGTTFHGDIPANPGWRVAGASLPGLVGGYVSSASRCSRKRRSAASSVSARARW